MKADELLRIHLMAKEFSKLYRETGLIGLDPDEVHLSLPEFYQVFGDLEYWYEGPDEHRTVRYKTPDGITYKALLSHTTVREVSR